MSKKSLIEHAKELVELCRAATSSFDFEEYLEFNDIDLMELFYETSYVVEELLKYHPEMM